MYSVPITSKVAMPSFPISATLPLPSKQLQQYSSMPRTAFWHPGPGQASEKVSKPRSLPPICLNNTQSGPHLQITCMTIVSAQHLHLWIQIFQWRSREKKERHVRAEEGLSHPPCPLARGRARLAHRRSAALRWPCSDRSSADSWAVRGLQHAACRRRSILIAFLVRVFFR
jgi:hypothetical protein